MNSINHLANDRRLDLARWGSPCYWSSGQGSDLKTYPIEMQLLDDGKSALLPAWDEESGEWHIGFEWSEPRDITEVLITYLGKEGMCHSGIVKVEYWNKNWPVNNPERH